jgi:lysyl-tRNA synthetase class 1
VKWAKGCGNSGTISPFDGRAKLPWKVEWPAKWKVMGVNIEGAGKDHSAAGGSRAIGKRIVEEIFEYPNPFDIPYEFFNLGGKKMSASKGVGASAKEIADLLPPYLLKLLMIRKMPNQPIDFDPNGTTIPLLFDEYDRLSDIAAHPKEGQEDFARTFALTQVDFPKKHTPLWQMRFTILSFVIQMPHLTLEEEAEKLKGSALTAEEKSALKERALYVKKWLDEHAPEQYRYHILTEAPEGFSLESDQKKALTLLADKLKDLSSWTGADIHATIHAVKEESGLEAKKLFAPLYQLFIERDSGPQMGWFLSTFSREDVLKRLSSATV